MRTFAVDIPVISNPGSPIWKRYGVKAENSANARELATFQASQDGFTIDASRRISATWTD